MSDIVKELEQKREAYVKSEREFEKVMREAQKELLKYARVKVGDVIEFVKDSPVTETLDWRKDAVRMVVYDVSVRKSLILDGAGRPKEPTVEAVASYCLCYEGLCIDADGKMCRDSVDDDRMHELVIIGNVGKDYGKD